MNFNVACNVAGCKNTFQRVRNLVLHVRHRHRINTDDDDDNDVRECDVQSLNDNDTDSLSPQCELLADGKTDATEGIKY
jgi:hypothetical protein